MKREFLLNILFLVFINLLIKPFFIFGIDLGVQNRVGPEAYGTYFALLSFTYLFQILNDFGIQNFNNSHIARHPQLLPKYFPNLLIIKGLFSFGYFFLTLGAAFFLGYSIQNLGLLAWLAANQILVALIFFLRSNVSGLGFYRTDSLLSSLDKLLAIFLMSGLLWLRPASFGSFKIEEFAFAQTLSLALTVAACLVVLRKNLRALRWHFSHPLAIFLLKKSAPFALVILLMTAYTRLDAVLLERLLPDGPTQAGIYGNGYRLLDALNMVGFLFATLLLPMFSRLIKEKQAVQPLLSLAFRILMAGAIPFCAAIFFQKTAISSLMNRHSTPFWGDVLGILVWVFIPVCVNYTFGTLLTANQSLLKMSAVFAVGLLLNLVLNLVFIPIWKAAGAAAATFLTQSLMAAAQIFLARKELNLKISAATLASMLGFLAFVLLTNFWISKNDGLSFFEKMGLGLVVGGASALVFNVLKIRQLASFRAMK